MDKITFDIPGKDGKWATYVSKYPADSGKVPPTGFTANTRNVITSATGQADKREGGAIWNPNSALSGPALDQYEAVFNTGTRLFVANDAGTIKASTGNGLFTTITAGFTNPANFEFQTYQSRVYGCNGVDSPITLDIVTSYGGVSYSFTTAKTKVMGCQIPGSAVTAARNTDSTANQVPAGSHTYKITFLYYSGSEESNANASASAVCVNDATHTSNALSAIPVGGYGVTGRNIYRDNNDGAYTLLATINDNTTTTYSDILPIGSTPTPLSITNGLPPVFKYVALYLSRLFVIDVTGKNIIWSNAGQPDVFNPANAIAGPQDDVMTAIYVFNGLPFVFGQHTVGTILGTTDGTFYYNPISTTTGCVDNRSIQTRSIVSVPTLMWLAATPNKGIYYTNGGIVQYLSDFIEDLTFNLAQISFLSRQNTQASQSAFQGGTASPGIDLLSNPGTIQTINPVANYSHAADWLTGTLANIVKSGDQLGVPVGNIFALGSGTLGGDAVISGGNITLGSGGNFTGESNGTAGTQNWNNDAINTRYHSIKLAQSIIPTVTGVLNTLSFPTGYQMVATNVSGNFTITSSIYNDVGGLPGGAIASHSVSLPGGNGADEPLPIPAATLNVTLTGGARYWIVVEITPISNDGQFDQLPFGAGSWTGGGNCQNYNGSTWSTFGPPVNSTARRLAASYTFTKTPVADTGTWTSAVYDSQCSNQTSGMSLTISGTYPANCSSTVLVQGSPDQSTWTTTDTLSSPNGTNIVLTGGQYRYWRIVTTVSTTNNLTVPLVGTPTLFFNTTGTWTSPAILCTTDITALNALNQLVSLPAGTGSTVLVRTSANGSSWSSYSVIGSATPNKYAQIQVTMTTDAGNTVSPSLASIELDWSVTSTLISSAIDTGLTPSGWGIFQYQQVGTSGTIAFSFRSASSSGGLTGSFSAVSNGGFPTATPLEWCQWKTTISATANNIPQVDSVTVNWFLSSGANVRAASLFFNKSYYLSVAITGSTQNNILIEYDYEGNWRIHSGATIGTLATYFNDAFYCDSTNGHVYNAFKLPTDNGTNIMFDLRTKCFDFGDNDRLKIVRSLKVTGVNTGTTIHTYYSMDRGNTWVEMLNSSGTLGYATTTDNSEFVEYFVPDYSSTSPLTGRNVIFRITSADAFPCSILQITPTVKMRKGKAIREAGAGV